MKYIQIEQQRSSKANLSYYFSKKFFQETEIQVVIRKFMLEEKAAPRNQIINLINIFSFFREVDSEQ